MPPSSAWVFSLVRGVLLRTLVNRGEDCLINPAERARIRRREREFFRAGDPGSETRREVGRHFRGLFDHRLLDGGGLGDPREVRAGVVNGSYFEVMALRPVLGRLDRRDDGPSAAPVCVLSYASGRTR